MNSEALTNEMRGCFGVSYRRVSTDGQKKSEFKDQLKTLKKAYPRYSVSSPKTFDCKEVISGKAPIKKRMENDLGACIRKLKHLPNSKMVVAKADRISCRADLFEVIQKQGLGHRIFDASKGLNLDQIVERGDHYRIEAKTEASRRSCLEGQQRYQQNGGVLGNDNIVSHGKLAAQKRHEDAERRKQSVEKAISTLVLEKRGKVPSHGEICDVLNEHGVRTGQRYAFDASKLSQLKKGMRDRWEFALSSYSRPRRKIRQLVLEALKDCRRSQAARRGRALVAAVQSAFYRAPIVSLRKMLSYALTCRTLVLFALACAWRTLPGEELHNWSSQSSKYIECSGCRGPPAKGRVAARNDTSTFRNDLKRLLTILPDSATI